MLRVRRELGDVDCQCWLHAGNRKMHEKRRRENGQRRLAMRQGGKRLPRAPLRDRGRRWLFRLMHERQREAADQAERTNQEERMAIANHLRESAAKDRSQKAARHLRREEHAHRPARLAPRRLRREERHDRRLEAAHRPLQQPEPRELPDALRKAERNHDAAEPARSAQNHRLPPEPVREPPPDGRENRERNKIAAEHDARPPRDILRRLDAELMDVERQNRRHLAHADRDDERSDAANQKIPFPDFHAKITRFILADEPRNSKAASA